jgi:hypothetical protein
MFRNTVFRPQLHIGPANIANTNAAAEAQTNEMSKKNRRALYAKADTKPKTRTEKITSIGL